MTRRILINAMTAAAQRQPVSTVCGGEKSPHLLSWEEASQGHHVSPGDLWWPFWGATWSTLVLGHRPEWRQLMVRRGWAAAGWGTRDHTGQHRARSTETLQIPPFRFRKAAGWLHCSYYSYSHQQLPKLHFRSDFSFSPCWCFSDICNWMLRPTLKLYKIKACWLHCITSVTSHLHHHFHYYGS